MTTDIFKWLSHQPAWLLAGLVVVACALCYEVRIQVQGWTSNLTATLRGLLDRARERAGAAWERSGERVPTAEDKFALFLVALIVAANFGLLYVSFGVLSGGQGIVDAPAALALLITEMVFGGIAIQKLQEKQVGVECVASGVCFVVATGVEATLAFVRAKQAVLVAAIDAGAGGVGGADSPLLAGIVGAALGVVLPLALGLAGRNTAATLGWLLGWVWRGLRSVPHLALCLLWGSLLGVAVAAAFVMEAVLMVLASPVSLLLRVGRAIWSDGEVGGAPDAGRGRKKFILPALCLFVLAGADARAAWVADILDCSGSYAPQFPKAVAMIKERAARLEPDVHYVLLAITGDSRKADRVVGDLQPKALKFTLDARTRQENRVQRERLLAELAGLRPDARHSAVFDTLRFGLYEASRRPARERKAIVVWTDLQDNVGSGMSAAALPPVANLELWFCLVAPGTQEPTEKFFQRIEAVRRSFSAKYARVEILLPESDLGQVPPRAAGFGGGWAGVREGVAALWKTVQAR